MRGFWHGIVALVCVWLVGCMPFRGGVRAIEKYNPFQNAAVKEKVVLRSVLIEQPTGDAYLTTGIWAATLKPLPPEKVALLAENGLRVGVFTTNAPGPFLERVHSEDATIRPTENTIVAGEAKAIPTLGPVDRAKFTVAQDIGAERIACDWPTAEFAFSVAGVPVENGKLKLTFEPRAQHGLKTGWLRPNADSTGFAWFDQKSQERYAKLSFEVTVSPGEFLIIGPTETPAEKLGGAWFITHTEAQSRMRLLVIRAWPAPGTAPSGPNVPGRKMGHTIAAQAGRGIARGSAN